MGRPQVKARQNRRSEASPRKEQLGQFFTPPPIAAFMAEMFPTSRLDHIRILDAGAGHGALTSAALARLGANTTSNVSVVAYEFDDQLLDKLRKELTRFDGCDVQLVRGDFIECAVNELESGNAKEFTHAILNPPYRKIASTSAHRHLLRRVGIETVNLYSAFVGLALLRLKPGGFLCAIIPRSFCNGPYYRAFRDLILKQSAVRRIHLFKARDRAFAHDAVLQENVIILLQRDGTQSDIVISSSTDATFFDFQTASVPYTQVVRPNDTERMFYLPSSEATANIPAKFGCTLAELGVSVSTGPVVDFRLSEHLRKVPGEDTVPLLYPSHFGAGGYSWPYGNPKKPSAIVRNDQTEKWLFPKGNYTVVRRLSSKEERRRIIANVVPESAVFAPRIGFENHLNVFHHNRKGLSKPLALGLMVYLNSSMLDAHFRAFNGHTQVNATDLRALPYPDINCLLRAGKWAEDKGRNLNQDLIDDYLERMK